MIRFFFLLLTALTFSSILMPSAYTSRTIATARTTSFHSSLLTPRYAPTDVFSIVSVGTSIANVPTSEALFTKVASGRYHALALKADGSVIGWGFNASGETNIPATAINVVDIAAGNSFSVALTAAGTVISWGVAPTQPPISGAIAIAAYESHALALRYDGTVIGWGNNTHGQVTIPADITTATQVCTGERHSLALLSNGTVRAWGSNYSGNLNIPVGMSNIVSISCGLLHSMALTADGKVFAWGNDRYGESSIPSKFTGIVSISAGYDSSIAIKSDGSVLTAGNNASNCLDTFSLNAISASAGTFFTTYIIAKPTISSVSPSTLPVSGGYVEITGTHIAGAALRLDGKFIPGSTSSNGVITAFIPAHAPGSAVLTLSTLAGSLSKTLTYDSSLPTITPSATLTPSPTYTPSSTPTNTRTATPSNTATYTNTPTYTPTRTRTPSRTRTYTRSKTPTRTATRTPVFFTRTPFWIPTKKPTTPP